MYLHESKEVSLQGGSPRLAGQLLAITTTWASGAAQSLALTLLGSAYSWL